jgi:hypothetical protein
LRLAAKLLHDSISLVKISSFGNRLIAYEPLITFLNIGALKGEGVSYEYSAINIL